MPCFGAWRTTIEKDGHLADRPPGVCKGFYWIGQAFDVCDRCGEPYWLHTHAERMRRDAAPFGDDDPFELVPITSEMAEAVRRKWGRSV